MTACGFIAGAGYNVEVARAYFAEAIGLARAVDDRWRLSQILALQAMGAQTAGDPRGCAQPPKKDATSPTRSATGSTRASVAFTSGWRR